MTRRGQAELIPLIVNQIPFVKRHMRVSYVLVEDPVARIISFGFGHRKRKLQEGFKRIGSAVLDNYLPFLTG